MGSAPRRLEGLLASVLQYCPPHMPTASSILGWHFVGQHAAEPFGAV